MAPKMPAESAEETLAKAKKRIAEIDGRISYLREEKQKFERRVTSPDAPINLEFEEQEAASIAADHEDFDNQIKKLAAEKAELEGLMAQAESKVKEEV